jgi:sugar lactone lactonase YvrE
MTPQPRVRWSRINRPRVLIPLLVAVVLSAWTSSASAEAPYVVYTANNSAQGAVILRSDPAAGSLVEISRNGSQGNLFVRPYDLAVERNGDLLVADLGQPNVKDGAVIRVNPYTGHQSLVSSGGLFFDPAGIAVAPDGSIYVIDNLFGPTGGIVIRVDPRTGAQQLIASNFNAPGLFDHSFGIAVDRDGSLIVANRSIAGGLPLGCGLAGSVLRVNPSNGTQSLLAGPSILPNLLSYPVGLAVDSTGAVVVANECPGGAGVVRVSGGSQSSVTPNGGGDVLRTPERVAITPGGNYVVSDYNGGDDSDGSIVRITPGGAQSTLSSGPLFNHPLGIEVVPNLPPVARLTATPSLVAASHDVKLDASGSRDPEGLQLVYEWDLDGNGTFETPSGTTPTATPKFATGGTRTLRVRVNDPHGGSAVATAVVRVDGSRPVVTRLGSGAPVLRLGRSTTIRFRLSEPATVKLELYRGRSGHRMPGGACSRAAKRGRSCVLWARARAVKRRVSAGTHGIKLRSRGLRPGHYRVVLTAVDAVGHRSAARTMRLRVTR